MSKYLLIESRDPFESTSVEHQLDLAVQLVKEGNEVTLFLVQNGVLPARPSLHTKRMTELKKAGVEIRADEFSLRERGIDRKKLVDGVIPSTLDFVVDRLAEGDRAIWH